MDHASVLDDFDAVDEIPAAHRGANLALARIRQFAAHDRAVDREIEFDAITGHAVGAAVSEGVENGLARVLAGLYDGKALPVAAGVSEMVVSAGDHAEAMPLAQVVLQRVTRPAAALGVSLVRVRGAVMLRAAPFGVNLQDRRDFRIDARRSDPAVPEPIGRVVRHEEAPAFLGEVLQVLEAFD